MTRFGVTDDDLTPGESNAHEGRDTGTSRRLRGSQRREPGGGTATER
jgi:hypothetical protein